MKIIHSFVKGTLPRLVGLKLALQLCFALQARACLFCSWKQLGVETHKKPVLCEMQKEYMIFQDSLPFVCFSLLLPSLFDDHLFQLKSLNAEAQFSAVSLTCQVQNVNCTASSEHGRCLSPGWIHGSPWHTSSYQHLLTEYPA